MDCAIAAPCPRPGVVPEAPREPREVLLLLHGSAASGRQWDGLRESLSLLYRVLAPDLIGYGKAKPWSGAAPLSLDDEAQRIDQLLPCCERSIHVAGYSYGGAAALALARRNPARVKSLTLIEPVYFNALRRSGEARAYGEFAAVRREFAIARSLGDEEGAMRKFVDFWSGSGGWDALPPPRQAAMRSASAKIGMDWEAAFAFDCETTQLAALAARTLLVRGDRSPSPMLHLVDSLHHLMPGSTLTVIPGANHLLPLTHGARLENALLAHLHSVSERTLP